jgi:glycosyltransferase involved in cell wall biosynthesis
VTATQAIIAEETSNAAASRRDDVLLSILIPFYRDDPTRLAASLNALIGARKDVEILMLDDGSHDTALNAQVTRTVRALSAPARLVTAARNVGRSAGRNLLAAKARGRWLLYLDADMRPGTDAFLQAYMERIEQDDFDAAFGGYETADAEDPAHDVHAALSRVSDHTDASARDMVGATAFCSSNLLVRAGVMRDVRFDENFTGWGWEDVDWAVRAARVHRLIHLDNPAWHEGLQPADSLLSKFRAGAVNYARLLEKHPQLAKLPGARAARTLAAIPLQRSMRGVFADLVRSPRLPMKVRTTALKLWRASWTAEAMG